VDFAITQPCSLIVGRFVSCYARRMDKEPRVIDAEYEIVRDVSHRNWNGIGLPPDWREWNIWGRLAYVVTFVTLMSAATWGAKALVRLIFRH